MPVEVVVLNGGLGEEDVAVLDVRQDTSGVTPMRPAIPKSTSIVISGPSSSRPLRMQRSSSVVDQVAEDDLHLDRAEAEGEGLLEEDGDVVHDLADRAPFGLPGQIVA